MAGSEPPISERDYYESQARQGDPEAIDYLEALPKLPDHGAHLWSWFVDPIIGLHTTRPVNGMAAQRLSSQHIRQWARDELIPLAHWERHALMRLDAAWASEVAAAANQSRDKEAKP